jgi:hypothetical protein
MRGKTYPEKSGMNNRALLTNETTGAGFAFSLVKRQKVALFNLSRDCISKRYLI